ncbi:hypothetical protein JD844_001505 [Phrynosoma platyrhinos]|uniref:CRIB domain-containing protein n=1 Tax=Phrynosoma platyrhinos TaxID=52577 RepID=A0ABQ7TAN8_PHRPL|nr:hypothetical protein JD844_001505 [Phrynosoma platyrhinos]
MQRQKAGSKWHQARSNSEGWEDIQFSAFCYTWRCPLVEVVDWGNYKSRKRDDTGHSCESAGAVPDEKRQLGQKCVLCKDPSRLSWNRSGTKHERLSRLLNFQEQEWGQQGARTPSFSIRRMPILKQSPVSHSKKRPRLDRAMISAPLGDFRHTMHIGRGGDAFGDTSFLSNHGGSKPNGMPPEVAVSPGTPSHPGDVSGRLELLSSSGSGNGVLQSPATSTPDGSFVVLQHPGTEDRQPQNKPPNGEDWDLQQKFSLESPTLEHAESLLSFQLDLGPSILEDVLGVMDKDWDSVKWEEQEPLRAESSSPVEQLHQNAAREEEEEEEEQEEEEGEEEEEEEDDDEGQGYSFEDEQDEEIGL